MHSAERIFFDVRENLKNHEKTERDEERERGEKTERDEERERDEKTKRDEERARDGETERDEERARDGETERDEEMERYGEKGRDMIGDDNEGEMIHEKVKRKKNTKDTKIEKLNEKESSKVMRNSDPWILDCVVLVSVTSDSEEDPLDNQLEVEVEVEGRGVESWEWSLGTFAERYSLMRTMRRTFCSCVCRRQISLLEQFYPLREHTDPFQDTPMVWTCVHEISNYMFFHDLISFAVFIITNLPLYFMVHNIRGFSFYNE